MLILSIATTIFFLNARLQPAGLLNLGEDPDRISFFDVGHVFDADPAFKTAVDLSDIILKPLQRRYGALAYFDTVAQDLGRCPAFDSAIPDIAARYESQLWDSEELSHLGLAEIYPDDFRSQQPLEGRLDIGLAPASDLVKTDIDFLALGKLGGPRLGTDMKTDYDGLRCRRQQNIGFRYCPNPPMK